MPEPFLEYLSVGSGELDYVYIGVEKIVIQQNGGDSLRRHALPPTQLSQPDVWFGYVSSSEGDSLL